MGSVNYIFSNIGQSVLLVVQNLDSSGIPKDLDGYSNWLDGYGYLSDGYFGDIVVDLVGNIIVDSFGNNFSSGNSGSTDGYYVPVVHSVVTPDLRLMSGYSQPMIRVGTGLYAHALQIPSVAEAIGTYIVSVSWMGTIYNWETYAVNAAKSFGFPSVTPL